MLDELRDMIRKIPKGYVSTYGAVAAAAGFPGAARQVVWALQDADRSGLPWHRVVGAGGKILLGGDAGFEQRVRLEAEGVRLHGQRVLLPLHSWPETVDRKRQVNRQTAKRRPKG